MAEFPECRIKQVLTCIPSKSRMVTGTWVHMDYLEGESRKQKQGSEAGKVENLG